MKTYACKNATNNSRNPMKMVNTNENKDTPNPKPAFISPKMKIKLKKANAIMWPAVMFANNRIINTNGRKNKPKISMGVNMINTGIGTPGIANTCRQ